MISVCRCFLTALPWLLSAQQNMSVKVSHLVFETGDRRALQKTLSEKCPVSTFSNWETKQKLAPTTRVIEKSIDILSQGPDLVEPVLPDPGEEGWPFMDLSGIDGIPWETIVVKSAFMKDLAQQQVPKYILYWLWGEMAVLNPTPGQGQWRVQLMMEARRPCTMKLKHSKQRQNVIMDPGQNAQLDGGCTYSCLAYIVWRDSSKRGADSMRRMLARRWQQPQFRAFLKKVSDWELCTPEQYVEKYVMMGWGGLPEILLCAVSQMTCITVVAADGTIIAEFGTKYRTTSYLLFDKKHYCVVRAPPVMQGHRAMASQPLRGGGKHDRPKSPPRQGYSPGLQLVSRDGTLRVEQPEEDTRPPLERRKRAAPKIEEEPDRAAPAPPDSPPPPKAMPTPSKPRKGKKDTSRKEESKAQEEKQQQSSSSRKKIEYTADDRFQDIHGITKEEAFGKSSTKKEGTSHTAASSSGAAASDAQIPLVDDEDPFKRCIVKVNGADVCALCGKWIDKYHLNSAKHKKNLKHYLDYDIPNQRIFARSCSIWVLENMTSTSRGGAAEAKKKQESPETSSDGGGFDEDVGFTDELDPAELKELQDWMEEQAEKAQGTEKDKTQDSHLALSLLDLLGPLPAADNDHELADCRHDEMHDFGEGDISECAQSEGSNETTVKLEDRAPEEALSSPGPMIVRAGHRVFACHICQHTQAVSVLASLAITMRLHTSGTALIRDKDMIVPSSHELDPLRVAGLGWQFVKLPIAAEHKQPAWDDCPRADIEIDERCHVCGGTGLQPPRPETTLSTKEERQAMSDNDADIVLLTIERARDTLVWQAKRGVEVAGLRSHYALVKRIRRSSITIFRQLEDYDKLEDDIHLALTTRGGAAVSTKPLHLYTWAIYWISDHIANLEYEMEVDGTVKDLLIRLGYCGASAWYQGAQLDDKVWLCDLQERRVHLLPVRVEGLPQLRLWEDAIDSGHIHLAELSEWWISRDVTWDEARQSLADLATRLDRYRMCRGAGPKGRLPWESSAAIKGVTLAYPFKDAAAIVPEITCDKVCDDATGVAFALLPSWQRLAQVKSKQPLMLILPGKCLQVLKKLGAKADSIREDELLIKDPDGATLLRRKATLVQLSDHKLVSGGDLKTVDWLPSASIEMIAEQDATLVYRTSHQGSLPRLETAGLGKYYEDGIDNDWYWRPICGKAGT